MEKRRGDEVDVLARDGEEAGHGEGDEAAGSAGVVVAWQAGDAAVEGGGDVGVDSRGGEGGAGGVVVLEAGRGRG